MARKEIKTYEITDDLTGETIPEEEAVTLRFSYAGTSYEIDLAPKNAKKLDDFIAPYVDAARRVRDGGTGKPKSPAGRDLGPVRTWAAENGYKLNPRGRVKKEVLEAYDAAH